MGKGKLRRPSQKVVTMTVRDINKLKMEVAERVLCLVTAYTMDELDYDEDKIVDLWLGIQRYSNAIKEHDITLKKVKDIIEDKTGIKMLGWK